MPAFAVTFLLPGSFSEEFLDLIPQHRSLITRLLAEHVIESYAITANRTKGWAIINGADEDEVSTIVNSFPLAGFFQEIQIDKLFVYDTATVQFPHISLN